MCDAAAAASGARRFRPSATLERLGIGLRDERDDDHDWLSALFATTRADEMAALPWPAAVKAGFLAQQFALQRAHYRRHHSDADRLVIVRGGTAIGRLYVDRTTTPWRLIDIALAPPQRSAGIGAALIRWLQRDARGVGIDLHVAHDNPRAARLYARLGFGPVAGQSATHARLAWP